MMLHHVTNQTTITENDSNRTEWALSPRCLLRIPPDVIDTDLLICDDVIHTLLVIKHFNLFKSNSSTHLNCTEQSRYHCFITLTPVIPKNYKNHWHDICPTINTIFLNVYTFGGDSVTSVQRLNADEVMCVIRALYVHASRMKNVCTCDHINLYIHKYTVQRQKVNIHKYFEKTQE